MPAPSRADLRKLSLSSTAHGNSSRYPDKRFPPGGAVIEFRTKGAPTFLLACSDRREGRALGKDQRMARHRRITLMKLSLSEEARHRDPGCDTGWHYKQPEARCFARESQDSNRHKLEGGEAINSYGNFQGLDRKPPVRNILLNRTCPQSCSGGGKNRRVKGIQEERGPPF